jgi:membrane protein
VADLARAIQTSHLGVEAALESLVALDWVAPIARPSTGEELRHVLLANPDNTPMAPLIHALLLRQGDSTQVLWRRAGWERLLLCDVLAVATTGDSAK